jgi:catechol 2,3-dioxygenase-like lactoylglutathione lyase family enzyme
MGAKRNCPMPEFKKAYVTIMVENLEKSVEFYNGLLGLYEDLRFGDSWAEMTTKGITIGIHPKKIGMQPAHGDSEKTGKPSGHSESSFFDLKVEGKAAHPAPPQVSIGFEVEDIRKTTKELEAKGIRFHMQENDINILAFFMDPDGTPLYLTQVR